MPTLLLSLFRGTCILCDNIHVRLMSPSPPSSWGKMQQERKHFILPGWAGLRFRLGTFSSSVLWVREPPLCWVIGPAMAGRARVKTSCLTLSHRNTKTTLAPCTGSLPALGPLQGKDLLWPNRRAGPTLMLREARCTDPEGSINQQTSCLFFCTHRCLPILPLFGFFKPFIHLFIHSRRILKIGKKNLPLQFYVSGHWRSYFEVGNACSPRGC